MEIKRKNKTLYALYLSYCISCIPVEIGQFPLFKFLVRNFSTGRWYEIESLCLLFTGYCYITNETEQTHYTSRSCDIIHVRLII